MNTPIPDHLAKSPHAGTSASLSINKMVVVGHPLSGYEGVENLLNTCGMRPAAASLRDGLSPAQVGVTLLKAHRAIPFDVLQAHSHIEPLQPGPIWQSLALDLLLGNINHDLWGWADPQAIYLLDYWKNLDTQMAFILVYDSPQDLIARVFENPTVACTPEILQTALNNWSSYNDTLLQFYHRNPQRCLLVHAAQVRAHAADCLHQVKTRIGAPLTLAPNQDTDARIPPPAVLDAGTNEACAGLADPHQALRVYVAQAILTWQPLAMQRYEELQASASLPLLDQGQGLSFAPALQALQAVVTLHKQQALQRQTLEALEAEKVHIASSLAAQIEGEKAAHRNMLAFSQQENSQLLTQLHQVQEELEHHFVESKNRQQKLISLGHEKNKAEQLIAERQQQIDLFKQSSEERVTQVQRLTQAKAAADKIVAERQLQIDQLKQAAEEAKVAQVKKLALVSTKLQQENDLLLAQLHQLQEDLERYHSENQRLKTKPLAPCGAAERVKQQLGYRLGSKMIERSRSLGGWLGMPFALMGVARQYKQELPQRKATQQVPIEKYRDAYEAERVKQHLSYHLGTALIKYGKNPLYWPVLPFSLQKARKAWLSQKTQ